MMRLTRKYLMWGLAVLTMAWCGVAQAQIENDLADEMAQVYAIRNNFSVQQRRMLSSGAADIFQIAEWVGQGHNLNGNAAGRQVLQKQAGTGLSPWAGSGPVPVNYQPWDYTLSRLSGFTQSETSSAWCGNNVVAGFNDSGAMLRSAIQINGGSTISGVAYSRDGGHSFRELAYLYPGEDPANFLGGDPVVVCTSATNFYYASLFLKSSPKQAGSRRMPWTGVAVNVSTDGGASWRTPIAAVVKDARGHFLDKEWMAADPNDPRKMYITYTDFDFSNEAQSHCPTMPGRPPSLPRVAIELIASMNGGISWSAPVVVEELWCPQLDTALQGSSVAVGPRGQVYVSWVQEQTETVQIRFRKSNNFGASFDPAMQLADLAVVGLPGLSGLQAYFRNNSFPTLAVDNSHGPYRGTIYLVWSDGTAHQIADAYSFTNTYDFGDIMLSYSADGGVSWTQGKAVSPTPAGFAGAGRDQFMPGVAVDSTGALAVCYYDRRNDALNLAVDRYCSVSNDQGGSFVDKRQTAKSWSPTHTTDVLINPLYMGDYDAVTSDATGANPGFFHTFQQQTNGNPDVYGVRF